MAGIPGGPQRAVRRTLNGTAAAAGLLLLLGASFAPAAEARTSCAYAGAPRNVLTVRGSEDSSAVIRRKGLEITVSDYREPTRCAGGTPTVLNTDTINVLLEPEVTAYLRLDGGPLAPGATPEARGASEIEIRFSGDASILGTSGDDEFHRGPGGARV